MHVFLFIHPIVQKQKKWFSNLLTCLQDALTGRRWCSTLTDSLGRHMRKGDNWGECPPKKDECGANIDCELKGGNKTICKENGNFHRKCVNPIDCTGECTKVDMCGANNRCTNTTLCSSSADCVVEEEKTLCKQHQEGGVKTCQRPETCSKVCIAHQFCGENNDCLIPGEIYKLDGVGPVVNRPSTD